MAPESEFVDLQEEKKHLDWSCSALWLHLTHRVFLYGPYQGWVPFSDLYSQQLWAAGVGGGKAKV